MKARRPRDYSKKQFLALLAKHSMKPPAGLGYVDVGGNLFVCRHNAGPRLREQLAYLIKHRDAHFKKFGLKIPQPNRANSRDVSS